MYQRKRTALYCLAGVLGCASNDDPKGDGDKVQTQLVGTLAADFHGKPRPIEVYDRMKGRVEQRLCLTEAKADGTWLCDLGALTGDVRVQVSSPEGGIVSADVRNLALGESRTVPVSPFTHLAAAYADQLSKSGLEWDAAVDKARRVMNRHFAGLPHHEVAPESVRAGNTKTLSDGAIAGYLWVGFDELARRVGGATSAGGESLLTQWTLLAALASDIRSDGLFNGMNDEGSIAVAGQRLTDQTLRGDLARALLAWIDSDQNKSEFRRTDFQALAEAIGASAAEIFPEGTTSSLDDQPPLIERFHFLDENDQPLGADRPIGGVRRVEVRAADDSGIAALDVQWLAHPNRIGRDLRPDDSNTAIHEVDTSSLADGAYALAVKATDALGLETAKELPFTVDNTAPTIEVGGSGRVNMASARVLGTAQDAGGAIARIVLLRNGRLVGEIEMPTSEMFSFNVDLDCTRAQADTFEVRVWDLAGNLTTRRFPMACDMNPPRIEFEASEFLQESTLEVPVLATPVEDYVWTNPVPAELGTSTEVLRLTKYANRLDAWSPNLPEFRIQAQDEESGPLELSYRYLVGDQVIVDWSPVERVPGAERTYSFKVSYQSTGPGLAEEPGQRQHDIEFRLRDAAGNEEIQKRSFIIDLRMAPVFLHACELAPEMAGIELATGNIHVLYENGRATPFLRAQVSYDAGLLPSSLAPARQVNVLMERVQARSRILALSEDKHPAAVVRGTCDRAPPGACQFFYSVYNISPARFEGCMGSREDPVFPEDREFWISDRDGEVADESVHDLALAVAGLSTRPVRVVAGGFALQSPEGVQVTEILSEPKLRVRAEDYRWSTTFSVPTGYGAMNQGTRYRLDERYWAHRGVDTIQACLTEGAWQQFVTRAYISRYEIAMSAMDVVASIPGRTDLTIPVIPQDRCASGLRYESSL